MDNVFTCTINNKTISMDKNFLDEYISSEKYTEVFEDNNNKLFGYYKSDFAEFLFEYVKSKNISLNPNLKILNFAPSAFKKLNKAIITNFLKINDPHTSNDQFTDKINIHPLLKEKVLDNLPNLSKEELAIYVYIKLCYLLRYDEQFDALGQQGKIAKMHEDINYASTITPTNNKIVCYEFVFLYSKFLKELDIDYLINSKNTNEYGMRHTSITLKIGNYTVLADPTKILFKDDLLQAKINTPLNGINCLDSNQQKRQDFKTLVSNIYNIYQQREPSEYIPKDKPNFWINALDKLDNLSQQDTDNKWEILNQALSQITLPQTEKMALANTIVSTLFKQEIENKQLCQSYFCQILPNKKYSTALGIAYNKEINGAFDPYLFIFNDYAVYDGKTFKHYSKDELQELFDDGKFNYIRKRMEGNRQDASYETRLPGIFENFNHIEYE